MLPPSARHEGCSMLNLMSFEEMIRRYEAGENAFDLTIEKWERIRGAIRSAQSPQHFVLITRGAAAKVALCVQFNDECHLCPLDTVCNREAEGRFGTVMRAMQAYCVAGDILPQATLLDLVAELIADLAARKEEFMKLRH